MSAVIVHQWVCVECREEGILTDNLADATGKAVLHDCEKHEPPYQPGDDDV